MDTIWFGVKLGVGIAGGMLAAFVVWRIVLRVRAELRELPSLFLDRRFAKAGFTWEENANVRGWLTRDPNNGEWIIWDAESRRVLRSSEGDGCWRVSAESLDECLAVGRAWQRAYQNRS